MGRRIVILGLVFSMLVLGSAPATADPFTDAYDGFRANVLTRLGELSGTLDSTQTRERKLLSKIESRLSRPSSSLVDDIRNARAIARIARKAPLAGSPLEERFIESLGELLVDLGALSDALRARLAALASSPLRDKASDKLDALAAKLDAAASSGDPVKFATGLLRGSSAQRKAEKKVGKAEKAAGAVPCTLPLGTLEANLDGSPWSAGTVTGSMVVNSLGVVLNVGVDAKRGADPFLDRLQIGLANFRGLGDYAANNGNVSLHYDEPSGGRYIATGGTITILEADPDAGVIRGEFDVLAVPFNVGGDAIRYTGTFEVTCPTVVRL